MVISDAKTPEAFRTEVCAEIQRSIAAAQAAEARSQSRAIQAQHRKVAEELAVLYGFFSIILFRDLPKSGEGAA